MNLPKWDAVRGEWVEASYPYPFTAAEAMFPGVRFALIHGAGLDAETLVSRVPQGWQLDFATAGKKGGDFIMTDTPVAPHFWDTPEEAVGYGSILMTPCWGAAPIRLSLHVLVVEDGELGTGDCHGKASPHVWEALGGDVLHAGQFRLGVKDQRILAKGTLVAEDLGVDLVLPVSAFKSSYKPEPGEYVWDSVLGICAWSQPLPTKFSWQLLQWFSWETIEADLLTALKLRAAALTSALADTRTLVDLLRLDDKELEVPFIEVLQSDKAGALNQHPYTVYRIAQMLRQRWLDLAHGAGERMTGLMALPNDALPFGTVATHDLPVGQYITTRYPLRYWGDIRVWRNVGGSSNLRGVVYMSHETAAALAGDFDGDYFQFAPVEDYPAMTKEIQSWDSRPQAEILKVKDRLASEMTQLNLARVMLENAESKVGIIATLIARANVDGRLGLIPKLAQELQVSVDKFKYNVEHDYGYLDLCHEHLPKVAWIKDRDDKAVYHRRIHMVDSDDTIGLLIQTVNAYWTPLNMMSLPLEGFKGLFPKPTDEKVEADARTINQRWGKLQNEIAGMQDEEEQKEARSRLHKRIDLWAQSRNNPQEWLAALWHAVHTDRSKGTGSLPFHAFPQLIAERVAGIPVPDKVSIVGIPYNDWAGNVQDLHGTTRPVAFSLGMLNGMARVTATVDGKMVGYASTETAHHLGIFPKMLEVRGAVVYARPPIG